MTLHSCWETCLRVLRRTDVFLVLLCLVLCLLMVQRYAGDAGEVAVSVDTFEPADASGGSLSNGQASDEAVTSGEEKRSHAAAEGGSGAGAAIPEMPAKMPKPGEPVRFLMLNAENYFVPGEKGRSRYVIRPKPVPSRDAVAQVIASARPEIVGLIEMGGLKALDDLKGRLRKLGLDYPHSVIVLRQGEDRALALLSMHPVVRDASRPHYGLYGQQRRLMLRGILDATVQLPDGRMYRIVGAHLKSRVSDDPAAATSLRKREAQTVARYLQHIMKEQPHMPVLLYGDWNDGPDDDSVQVLRQGVSRDAAMTRLKPQDSRGDYWTIYHRQGQQYYTFDQVYVNRVLGKRMGRDAACGIVDGEAVSRASDHRAIWCDLR